MQIAFFLLPKNETMYLTENLSVRQALEKMQHHGYTAVPLLDKKGLYVGAITVADFLWYIKDKHNMNMDKAEKMPLTDIPRKHNNQPVSINANIKDLFLMALEQNFIPVIDDLGVFIGIVRRREIMDYYLSHGAI